MTDPDLARLCFIHNKQNVTSDGELMSVQLYKMKITRLFEEKKEFLMDFYSKQFWNIRILLLIILFKGSIIVKP